MSTTRREFLVGCSGAVAAMAGSRLTSLCFGDATTAPAAPHFGIVIVLFLRGGMDGLNLVAPVNDPNYIAARPPELRVVADGDGAGLALANGPAGLDFRIHPAAKPLKDLYDAGQLAVIHAAGLTSGTRSHFEAMDLIERGVSDGANLNIASGWLARHLELASEAGALPAITTSETPPASLLGASAAVAIPDLSSFAFYGDDPQLALVQSLYGTDTPLHRAGSTALAALKAVKDKLPRNDKGEIPPYAPKDGVMYPGNDLTGPFQTLARLIKLDIGLTTAAVDLGGWDTHQSQANTFAALVDELSTSLAAFYNDLDGYHERLNIIVMSEFGRRLKSNESAGTDHGHGNVMLALGGSINGGKIYGKWPGLANEQLDGGADLAITTDYRTVLSELLVRRFGETKLSLVFPGFAPYQPLGIFKGADVKTDIG